MADQTRLDVRYHASMSPTLGTGERFQVTCHRQHPLPPTVNCCHPPSVDAMHHGAAHQPRTGCGKAHYHPHTFSLFLFLAPAAPSTPIFPPIRASAASPPTPSSAPPPFAPSPYARPLLHHAQVQEGQGA